MIAGQRRRLNIEQYSLRVGEMVYERSPMGNCTHKDTDKSALADVKIMI